MNTNRRTRPLYRDPNNKMIGGVCSGLGYYFDIDTLLIRVGFVVVALVGGGGVLAYLILWAALDPAPPGALGPPSETETPALEDTVDTEATLDDQGETPVDTPAPEELGTDAT